MFETSSQGSVYDQGVKEHFTIVQNSQNLLGRKWNFGVKIIFEDNDFNIHIANLLPMHLYDLDKINNILFFLYLVKKELLQD